MPSRSNPVAVLTIEDVELLHQALTDDCRAGNTVFGVGPFTPSARAGWEANLAALHPLFGSDAYPTVALKAARVLYGGATTQYLLDGNKRLATMAMLHQLMINGYELAASWQDLAAFVLGVAVSSSTDYQETVATIAVWIEDHMIARDD